jgi:hypothetical protein
LFYNTKTILQLVILIILPMNFIVRHGERADFCDNINEKKKIRIDFDPHLTKNG